MKDVKVKKKLNWSNILKKFYPLKNKNKNKTKPKETKAKRKQMTGTKSPQPFPGISSHPAGNLA